MRRWLRRLLIRVDEQWLHPLLLRMDEREADRLCQRIVSSDPVELHLLHERLDAASLRAAGLTDEQQHFVAGAERLLELARDCSPDQRAAFLDDMRLDRADGHEDAAIRRLEELGR